MGKNNLPTLRVVLPVNSPQVIIVLWLEGSGNLVKHYRHLISRGVPLEVQPSVYWSQSFLFQRRLMQWESSCIPTKSYFILAGTSS